MSRFLALTLLAIAWGVLVSQPRADEPSKKSDDAAVRVLILKNAPDGSDRGNVRKPTVIDGVEKLDKAFANKDVRAEIKDKVDFKQEFVLVFSWAGSGQDKLTFGVNDGKATFLYAAGLTRDLRPHFYAYVLKNKTTWDVKNKKGE